MGLADHTSGFEAVAYLDVPAGDVAFVSQSGAMGEEFVMRAREWGCGFSRYVTLGNQADVNAAEILSGLAGHEATRVVVLYVEDFGEGRAFARAAASVVSSGRPVVLLTPGLTAAGARAARSHTGALAPASAAVDAVCRAAGITRAETPRELFELAMAFRSDPRPAGRRVAVVSDGGGPGGVAADALAAAGFTVPEFGPQASAAIREALPGSAGDNPVDFALGTIEPDAYARVLPAVAGADAVDAVFAVGQLGYWSARFPEFEELAAAEVAGAASAARAVAQAGVPLVVGTVYPQSAPAVTLRANGVPVYREIASGVRALAALAEDAERRSPVVPELPGPLPPLRDEPDYWQARGLLAAAGVPVPPAVRAATPAEARAAAADLGGSVVLKALGVLHKTEAGAVVTGLPDPDAVERAARDLTARLDPPGLVVEAQAPVTLGVELIVGCRRDPVAGPLTVVGMGGVLAELLRDVRVALAPTTPDIALELLRGLRAAAVFDEVRGRPALDLAAAADAVAALTRFAAAHREVAAAEVNPLLVLPEGALALDARIVLHDDAGLAGDLTREEVP
jgi:acyl-CoA synthetase (NDP forming)